MPSKEKVREWFNERAKNRKPLPEISEIRRQLEWEMRELNRKNNEIYSFEQNYRMSANPKID